MISKYPEIHDLLFQFARSYDPSKFFKTGKGEYSHHDKFLGVRVPRIREISKNYRSVNFATIKDLLKSSFNEERLLALIIMIYNYDKNRDEIYQLFLKNIDYVNNWNLVDSSAHLIIGRYAFENAEEEIIFDLAKSKNLWHRRIAIVSTLYFIKKNSVNLTYILAEILFNDSHDLIHKATGWMLREAGKKDPKKLIDFLIKHQCKMPRTMLRYANEIIKINIHPHSKLSSLSSK